MPSHLIGRIQDFGSCNRGSNPRGAKEFPNNFLRRKNMHKIVSKTVTDRAERLCNKDRIPEFLDTFGFNDFYVAGGCLTKDVRDIDIFPIQQVEQPLNYLNKHYFVSRTRNAVTFNIDGQVIQICNYIHDSLRNLVDSFDFSHIQVGCKVAKTRNNLQGFRTQWIVQEVYFTEDFLIAKALEDSKYTSSGYPLSSLVRILKYYKRDHISRGSAVWSIINILVDIIKRGFKDYEDFKDQLDAVDLGMLPDEIDKIETSKLAELFELLRKDK
jgi:hypothetical protein